MRTRALQEDLVRCIRGIKRDHVGNRQASVVVRYLLDDISGADLPFAFHREVKTASSAPQEPLYDVNPPEAYRELVAWHAGAE